MFRLLSVLGFLGLSSSALAQAPGVPIFDQSRRGQVSEGKALGAQITKLVEAEEVLSREAVGKMLKSPTPRKVSLPEASAKELAPSEIADLAQRQNYRVGWCYICTKCDNWHFDLGGGYAVAEDGVIATCAHVVELDVLPEKFKKAALIAIDSAGKVHPVTGILANHTKLDAAIVTIDAKTTPYALNEQVSPGDAAYCFSRPMDQGKYFTAGIVNRFYWDRSPKGNDQHSLRNLANLKLNVSSRWAPGSSGSPVFDHCGNVIGHVAMIQGMSDGDHGENFDDSSLITLHSAIPARSVRALILDQE